MNILSLYNNYYSKINEELSLVKKTGIGENGSLKGEDERLNFKNLISKELERLNNRQIAADDLVQKFVSGEVDDLHSVMIAAEEARLTLELAVQLRNRCIEAYKEINNMQL